MAKSNAGGGINSNKLVRPPVRYGESARAANVKAVSQIGSSLGNRATQSNRNLKSADEPFRGERNPNSPLGNEVAKNVGEGGPGRGRTTYATGSQARHGGER